MFLSVLLRGWERSQKIRLWSVISLLLVGHDILLVFNIHFLVLLFFYITIFFNVYTSNGVYFGLPG